MRYDILVDNMLLNIYKKTSSVLCGYGLRKISIISFVRNFIVRNLRSNCVIINGHNMFLDKLDSLQLLVNDVYEPVETKLIKTIIKKNDIVLDVGSHVGYYTLLLSDLVGVNGKVFAFEPEFSNFNLLKKNLNINQCKNVVVENKAVSVYTGKSRLYLCKDNSGMHRLNQSKYCKDFIDTNVIGLDDYFVGNPLIDKIRFVKIDVEGSEFDVLNGMKLILEKNTDIIILMEFIVDNLVEHGSIPIDILLFLSNYGFKLYIFIEDGFVKEISEHDFKNMNCYDGKSLLCVKSNIIVSQTAQQMVLDNG